MVKPVVTMDAHDSQKLQAVIHNGQIELTKILCEQIKCNGPTIVMTGIFNWLVELGELDPGAMKQLANALSTIADPRSTASEKKLAQERRAKAAKRLFAAADFHHGKPEGRA